MSPRPTSPPGIFAFTAVCLLGACLAQAQSSPSPAPTPAASPTASATPPPTRTPNALNQPSAKDDVDRQRTSDAGFMTRAQLRGLEEIELGRIAATRAANTDVRSLGQQIVEDRGKINEELARFARAQSVDLPTALEPDRRAEVDRISRLSSPELDRAFVRAALRTHDADVADFQKQTQAGQEVELQGWVYDTLPVLEEQQGRIHGIASKLGIAPRAGPA